MADSSSKPPRRSLTVEEMFLEAISRPPAERELFFRSVDPEDRACVEEAARLAACHDAAGGFLEPPAPGGTLGAKREPP